MYIHTLYILDDIVLRICKRTNERMVGWMNVHMYVQTFI